jgi:uncharacterized protein YggU (UPF0235/DUF167 family)
LSTTSHPTSSSEPSSSGPFSPAKDGARVAVRLTPRASADRIDGIVRDAAGAEFLKVLVTAPAAENRANEALLQLLARAWRLPRRDLAIAGGAKNRNKIVHIAGDPATLTARLAGYFASYRGLAPM